ncbi:MAG: DUF992 domain-containing protein [Alphaproteobacteria bacterium]|jgi:hypothetical protein|nr:DUF992 domain-containing protein [Alphaproteobacteria bacterium]MBN9556347.1 DUF992 domain-containing protein [Alphaproteobacteria bacterium]MBN9578278.1 DUF992 domain-containing protein [Alphaproteobacteria bacterium]MBN9591846.1 DUF992 domain-containing protein [Alphaproteobacteria bacterium]
MKKPLLVAVAAGLAAASAALPAQAAESGVKIGTLTCNVASGWGFVFGSSKDLRCNFRPNKRHGEHYAGTINKYGVDIGYTQGGVLIWAVIAPTSDVKPGALEGDYAGVTAGASVGVGASANALIGGFDKSITLQPLSIEGNTGLNVAAGIGAIHLAYVPNPHEQMGTR